MGARQGKQFKILKGEKLIWTIIIILVLCTPILMVFTKATLSESNIRTERLRNKINQQTNTNESLSMQINELASLDNIKEVIRDLGLSYNENNVKVIRNN